MSQEQDRQRKLRNKESGDPISITGLMILIEWVMIFAAGIALVQAVGTEKLLAIKGISLWGGAAGIILWFILHKIPGIRWLMMISMVLLWALAAYVIGMSFVGEGEGRDGIYLVSHQAPYFGAFVVGLIRAFAYRQ